MKTINLTEYGVTKDSLRTKKQREGLISILECIVNMTRYECVSIDRRGTVQLRPRFHTYRDRNGRFAKNRVRWIRSSRY